MEINTVESVSPAGLSVRLRERLHAYLLLVKPRILLLVALTSLAAMVLEGSLLNEPARFGGVLLGIMLAGAAANSLNQYWDRDIDRLMARTSSRPLATGKITPRDALGFSLLAGMTALWLLLAAGGWLAALLGLGTMVWYVLIYTIWLKRRTPLNIVIGGVAGAAAPLIGWAAGAGELAPVPLLMFLVIFLWTPPHFWALALYLQDDYARARIPMLPVVAGETKTRAQITTYVLVLLPATLWLGISANLGWIFFTGSALLGLNLFSKVHQLRKRQNHQAAWSLFSYSIFYLAMIFLLLLAPGW